MGVIARSQNAIFGLIECLEYADGLDFSQDSPLYVHVDKLLRHKHIIRTTGCSYNIVFFQRILESSPPRPRQHSTAIGCTKIYQPLGVTVHSHCVESFEGLLQRCRQGRGCREL